MALGEKPGIDNTAAMPAGELVMLGPYRVHEHLGSGGMGEVYKAYDDRLERWVAIKRIRPDKEAIGEHRSRLRREARSVARLNHPAIVQVYDIFEDQDSDCIVMELVEGTSLDQLIQREPLDPFRVAEIGRQIAAGLEEAHEKGILHRDLKTENVIITAGDQPKILDFGLAKPLFQGDLDSTLTGKGQVVGTSRTMSPEYVSGDAVDHRSDLFSLGVLLYEAATGVSPFKAHNSLATLKRVILHRQPPVHEVNPAVPVPLSELIDALLEKEPDERPQTAGEVAETLAFLTGTSSASLDRPASTGSFAVLPHRSQRRRWWLPALASAAILLGLGTAWALVRSRAGDPSQRAANAGEATRVVLGDFVNRTGEDVFDGPLDTALRIGLNQSRAIAALTNEEVTLSLKRMAQAPDTRIDRKVGLEIAQREGALGAIFGQIDKIGQTYALSAELVEPQHGRTLFATSETAPDQSSILPRLQMIVAALRTDLGETAASIHQSGPQLEKVTTPNLQALKAYSRGVDRFNQSDYGGAIPLFEHAIELDPGFAMAHAKLGATFQSAGRIEDAAAHFTHALQSTDRLSSGEELYVRAWMATWSGTPDEMLDAWSKLREMEPERIGGHNNYALTAWFYFHRAEDALAAINEAAVHASPGMRARLRHNEAYLELFLGHFAKAEASFREAEPEELALLGLTKAYMVQEAMDSAWDALEQVESHGPMPAVRRLEVTFNRVLLDFAQGKLPQSIENSTKAIDEAIATGNPWWENNHRIARLAALAWVPATRGAAHAARFTVAIERGRALLDTGRFELGFSPLPLLAVLGKLAVRQGYVEQGRDLLAVIAPQAQGAGFSTWTMYVEMLEGEIRRAEGKIGEAGERLQTAGQALESFQVHESLAALAESSGDLDAAIKEYSWLVEHPGRAVAECLDFCFDSAPNVLALGTARGKLALLYAQRGDAEKAREQAQAQLHKWQDAPQGLAFLQALRPLVETATPPSDAPSAAGARD